MHKISALPSIDPLDRRLNAFRSDLADVRLRTKVKAERFVAGTDAEIRVPVADLKSQPAADSETCHQLLLGEPVAVFEQNNDWSWVQSGRDFYVGYVERRVLERFQDKWSRLSTSKTQQNKDLSEGFVETKTEKALDEPGSANDKKDPSHIVCAPSTFLYPQAELKRPPIMALSMGSLVKVLSYQSVRGTKYAILDNGSALIAKHLCALDAPEKDYVTVCELLENVPYLWGGASGFGIDCAGLVQLAMRMSGREVLRDSDMQGATIGEEIDAGPDMENLRRGDLIFWRGHVAVCQDDIGGVPHIIHASGFTMNVASEPLHQAIKRIAHLYERPIGFKRCS